MFETNGLVDLLLFENKCCIPYIYQWHTIRNLTVFSEYLFSSAIYCTRFNDKLFLFVPY